MAASKKRYAVVGVGGRSEMYTNALVETYKDTCELVGLCDINQGRLDLRNRRIADRHAAVPTFLAGQFDQMIAQVKPDVVIVTTGPDATHADYICRAMELGCDVVAEKPMTTDEVRCRRILETARRTGRKIQVTFNYRYSPPRSQVKELIQRGSIGEIFSVDFAWVLDTRHGADYFRRWHRRMENSGSLLVHKATHHFDLVNWWIDDVPEEVFAHGSLRYYTPATADRLGLQGRTERCHTCPLTTCQFRLNMAGNARLKEMYLDCEGLDGYFRDRCVFSEQINIWDTMSVSVRYSRGALLNYMLHAYSPVEGYRIAFNGAKGRIEHQAAEKTYINGDGTIPGELESHKIGVTLIPEFARPQALEPRTATGGHGGGDPVLLADVFDPNAPADPLKRKANQRDGTYSIMVGIAAYHSIAQGKPIRISDLIGQSQL